MNQRVKFLLDESDLPTAWYNLAADVDLKLAPPLHPATLQPLGPDDLAPLFPPSLIQQEMCTDRLVDIPGQVLDVYRLYRPTPLVRARRLELALGTPARIYYKYEGVSPAGSHKPNTAIAQAYYNRRDGTKRLTTETGAGQWGSALSMACSFFDLECTVYMVRVSYEQKPYRRSLMGVYGAKVLASPSPETSVGRAFLEADPGCPGSLGIAISEAVEDAAKDPRACYSLGSVLNHVLLHQTVIGLEAREQMAMAGDHPDVIVGCLGGGSNFAGLTFPFLEPSAGKRPSIVAVEPTACPTLTRGVYAYDYGDTGRVAPVVLMHTLGHSFIPSRIHAGGLRYHGAAPMVSSLLHQGLISARAVKQTATFEAGVLFARTEGILPAPESAHAIRATVDLALEARAAGTEPCILFGLSGHGHFDLSAYEAYFDGNLEDYDHPQQEIERALSQLPKVSSGGA
ncbi:MAG: TrpB-like pyridoxal phosphate-dependent enzyme [Bacillota bacterium]